MIGNADLSRLIAAYESQDPKLWHNPADLPAVTLDALRELQELRETCENIRELVTWTP